MYEGRVVVTNKKRLYVWKNHIYPGCDYPKEPIEENIIEIEDISIRLSLAA
jgi:hypothetical protein